MGYGLINYSTLKDLANAIRKRLKSESNLTLQEMEEAMDTIDFSEDQVVKSLIEHTVTKFVVPEDVTTISYRLFQKCYGLQEIEFHNGIKELPGSCFRNCTSLTSIKLPEDLEILGGSCFQDCSSLLSINLPDTLKTLSYQCFWMAGITEINIPASVETIESEALGGNSNLKTITFLGKPNSIDGTGLRVNSAIINVPWAEGEVANAPWGATNSTINYNYSTEAV